VRRETLEQAFAAEHRRAAMDWLLDGRSQYDGERLVEVDLVIGAHPPRAGRNPWWPGAMAIVLVGILAVAIAHLAVSHARLLTAGAGL
jgi:hypothetical protein